MKTTVSVYDFRDSYLTTAEQERAAYLAGDTRTAEILARIVDLEAELEALKEELDQARAESLTQWTKENGPADAYRQFFYDCFDRLAKHYPAPSITSDYDQSVIFEAIARGEGGAA